MSEPNDNIELRSEEVQEILGSPPSSLVRWGTTLCFFGIMALGFVAWMIKYSDVIEAKIVLTTSEPPVDVIARADGHIAKWMVTDKQEVDQGAVLAILQSTGRVEDILFLNGEVNEWLQKQVDSLKFIQPKKNLELGDMQSDYSLFIQSLENYVFSNNDRSSSNQSRIVGIKNQIAQLRRSIIVDDNIKKKTADQLAASRTNLKRQQEMLGQGLISDQEYRNFVIRMGDLEKEYEGLNQNAIARQSQILDLEKKIDDISFGEKEDVSTLAIKLRESLNQLRSGLDRWRQNYLFTAPIKGRVSLNNTFFSAQQFVRAGDQILALVPPSVDSIVGRLDLPVQGSGKVKIGQRVIVRMDSYPYKEFGTVEARVESKALVPKNNQYSILVKFPNGLKTNHHTELKFEQQMQGTAQIVTETKRFLTRITENIFSGMEKGN